MNFTEALQFLDRFINREATAGRIHGLSLAAMSELVECMGEPHKDLKAIHVTGTNGKTTTTHFLSDILSSNNIDHGSVGTLGTFINNELVFQNQLTTEEPTYNRSFLDVCNKKNIDNASFAYLLNYIIRVNMI